MIGIKINGTFLDLDPDTTIPYDINSDILNFEEVEGTISFPFYFSNTPTNEQTFNHSCIIAVKNNKRYYDAEIFFKGHKIYDAEFELESAGGRYEGRFLVDAAIHYRYKDKLISDIITKEITLPGKQLSDLNGYIDKENDMVFPLMHFQDYFDGTNPSYKNLINWYYLDTYAYNYTRVITTRGTFAYWSGGYIPCFKMIFVLKSLLEAWDYSLIDYASRSEKDLRYITLFNNVQIDPFNKYYNPPAITRGLPEKIKVADHLPKITVSKFLQMIRSFGITINFDSNKRLCKIKLIKDVIADNEHVDWSKKAVPAAKINFPVYRGIKFSFIDSKDKRQKDSNKKSLDENVSDPVDQLSDLPTPDETIINQLRLVREFNAWYQCDEDESAPSIGPYYIWKFYKDANEPMEIDDAETTIEAPWSPIHESNDLQYKLSGTNLVDNGSGKIKVTFEDGLLDAFNAATEEVAITKPSHDDGNFSLITAIDGISFEADINYSADASEVEFTVRRDLSVRVPDVDIAGNYQMQFNGTIAQTYKSRSLIVIAANNTEFTARLMFYYGVIDSAPLAGASGFDNSGNRLTDFSLRWAGDDGLYEYFWEDVVNFQKNLKEVEQPVVLDLGDIINFDRFRKVMIDNNKYLVKRIKAELTMQGIAVSNVEMYSV